jgi:hypothetical protein
MNKVVYYQPEKHQSQLLDWLQQWNLGAGVLNILPPTGLIIEDTAVVFCYETNSKVCFVELLLANKKIDKEVRNAALDELVKVLMHMMKEKGFEYMMSYSRHDVVVERAIKHGFEATSHNYTCFGRVL